MVPVKGQRSSGRNRINQIYRNRLYDNTAPLYLVEWLFYAKVLAVGPEEIE